MAHMTCGHEGCSKAPSFGFPGGERSACSAHKRPGMQYLKHEAGTDKAQAHVPRGLDYAPSVQREPASTTGRTEAVGAKKKQCRHAECTKAPSFGFPNEERLFCSAHKRPGMEYLAGAGEHHRGGAGDALTQAMDHVPKGLNYHHSSDRRSAPSHASAAGTAVAGGVHCQEGECTKAPSYGWPGVPGGKPDIPVMCAMHKRPAMVYLRQSADSGAGAFSGKPAPSKDHVPRGLEYIPSVTMENDRVVHSDHPHCVHKGCTKAPSYGLDGHKGTHCFSHKRAGMAFLKRGAKPTIPTEAKRHASSPSKAPSPSNQAPSSSSPSNASAEKPHAEEETSQQQQQQAEAAVTAVTADDRPDGQPAESPATSQPDLQGEVVEADLGEARRCVALARQNLEDPTFGMKYLANIVKNPDEVKYRTLKLSNRKFYSEVWLNSGMRGVFLGLGFRQRGRDAVVLDPLSPNALQCMATVLQELAAGR